MKKLLIFILTSFLLVTCSSTKLLKEEVKIENGVKVGAYVATYSDYREEGDYINGKKEGKVFQYNNDGVVEEITYKNGVREGSYKINYPDGDRDELNYKNGVIDGEGTYYFKDGKTEKVEYKYNPKTKILTRISSKGKLEISLINEKITGQGHAVYLDGSTLDVMTVNGRPQGKGILKSNDEEKIKIELNFINGKPEGKAFLTREDGGTGELMFKDGKMNGVSIFIEKDGSVRKEIFKNDKKMERAFLYLMKGGVKKVVMLMELKKENMNIFQKEEVLKQELIKMG